MNQLDWNRLFLSHEGRISRQPFWIGVAIMFVVQFVVSSVVGTGIIGSLISLALIYPTLCVYIKRCHDRGKSGWWVLLLFLPVVTIVFMFMDASLFVVPVVFILGVTVWWIVDLGILKGTDGPNDYGPDPLGGATADAFD